MAAIKTQFRIAFAESEHQIFYSTTDINELRYLSRPDVDMNFNNVEFKVGDLVSVSGNVYKISQIVISIEDREYDYRSLNVDREIVLGELYVFNFDIRMLVIEV